MASLSPGGLVALGVIVGLVSTCVQSVGLTLQRKSHILEDEKEEHLPRRAPYRRRRWQIGMLLFLLSNIVGSSIQITTLPLPLLSTLQASGLVFNALLASLLLHEPFTRRTALGTLLVTAGAVLISRFSALPEPSHNLDQLLDLLLVRGFLVWMSLTLLLVVVIIVATFVTPRILPPHRRTTPRARLLRGMSYGLVSGILSAHALLLAKSAVELLVRTVVDRRNQFDRPQAWILLLLFLFFALTQLYYLHHGLKLVSTSILYPFVFCIYNIIAILDGLIYFRQTDRLPPLHSGLIALGTVVLLTGVLALSWRLSSESEDDEEYEPGLKADLPHSALTPGLGLVDERANDVRSPLLRRYFDDEEEDAPAEQWDAPASSAPEETTTERDPLLPRRHPTLSSPTKPPGGSASSSPAARARRHTARRDVAARRRSTMREVQAVWDELRDERNWFPPSSPALGTAAGEASPSLGRRRARASTTVAFRDVPEEQRPGPKAKRPAGGRSVSWAAGQEAKSGGWWGWWRRRRRDEEEEEEEE